jgi:hypothetical protein
MITTALPTVDTTSLETVTGGAIRAAAGDTTAQLTQLTQLLSQLQSTNGTGTNGNCHNNGGFGSMGMIMLMLAMRERRPEPVVFVGPPRPWGY